MSVYQLDNDLWFPPPHEYEDHGIVAVGGDLSVERLLLAYRQGLFPWYNENEPITWYCPATRMVLKPGEVKISKSSRNLLNRDKFEIRIDSCFEEVIDRCQQIRRPGQDGTWLNDALKNSIIELHRLGFAHSFETFEKGKLVGGLYGLSIGRVFFGDSMFSEVSNASKIAFIKMCQRLAQNNFQLIDCQVYNPHLESLGAEEISRDDFLQLIKSNYHDHSLVGNWGNLLK